MSDECSTRAAHLLGCALTFRDAKARTAVLPTTFDDAESATHEWMRVLLHEAREAMHKPLEHPPEQCCLHPVDVDTAEPGIVDVNEEVKRPNPALLPKAVYRIATCSIAKTTPRSYDDPQLPKADPRNVPVERHAEVETQTQQSLQKAIEKAQKRAVTAERQEEKRREAREARAQETPEARRERLDEAKRKREERKAARLLEASTTQAEGDGEDAAQTVDATTKKKTPTHDDAEEAVVPCVDPDASHNDWLETKPKKRRRGKEHFFEHPLPHDRHLQALEWCQPHPTMLPALLRGEATDALEVVQGPPGTGKTRELVARLVEMMEDDDDDDASPERVLLCAPTNVGAANLYRRCVEQGLGDCTSLVLPPDRVPLGTAVLSDDPKRRFVCATVSGRAGRQLCDQVFQVVYVDEAAQCMEAWIWTLLRAEVHKVVLAGDVQQLPAQVSETGRSLKHERSLMERLVRDLQYPNVFSLTVQNRMAPELLAFPNETFYANALITGQSAPDAGKVIVLHVDDGTEEEVGTSVRNRAEAAAVGEWVRQHVASLASSSSLAIIAPYQAQCKALLAQSTGAEIHTVDSFQGREADTVVLSVTRDGTRGFGFWSDPRRLTVALTRAKSTLVLAVSRFDEWKHRDDSASSLLAQCVRRHTPFPST